MSVEQKTLVRLGDMVPLRAISFNGDEDLEIEAVVFSPSNEEIFRGQLTHQQDGVYRSFSLNMPNLDFLIALYIPKKNGKEDKLHARGEDFFELDKSLTPLTADAARDILDEKLPDKTDFLIGQVEEILFDDFFEARISDQTQDPNP